ncbi:YihY/virulence factor BrkB family protein [Halioxenophilus aromaticivorans]|uniref:YihY/virulence factor BrkB family protein n=1 Tax=Halioxenophilus aromaticivorans TaxID=1306992 RepID=A0AAV3TY30_9ALTE
MNIVKAKDQTLLLLKQTQENNLSLVSAGVAFYGFLSIFPSLAALISLYGLIFDPANVVEQVNALAGILPPEVHSILQQRLSDITTTDAQSLKAGVIFGILLSLWSANRAMKAFSEALNIVFSNREQRNFIQVNLVTLALTLASIVVFIIGMIAIVGVPIVVSYLLSQSWAQIITGVLSWLLFVGLVVGLFLMLYRFAPASPRYEWREHLPGSILATVLFLSASVAFSFYVSNFGDYDEQYGALGAVVVTLFWLYIGAFIFLLGAEINAMRIEPSDDLSPGYYAEKQQRESIFPARP